MMEIKITIARIIQFILRTLLWYVDEWVGTHVNVPSKQIVFEAISAYLTMAQLRARMYSGWCDG